MERLDHPAHQVAAQLEAERPWTEHRPPMS
jgi:hypothetical protein